MKNLLLVLPLLSSCAALDRAVGADEPTDKKIEAGEETARQVGDILLPGAGGVLATLLFGTAARAYKRRRAGKANK